MAAQENGICFEDEVLQLPDLPQDLITDHILLKLPIKSLLRFKSVSKLWYSTLSSHKFATAHFKLSPFSHPNSPTQCLFIHSGLFYNLFFYDDDDVDDEKTDANNGRKGLVRLKVSFDMLGDKFHLVGSCNGLVCLASLSGYFIIWNPITHQRRKIAGPFSLKYLHKSKAKVSWGFGYASSVDEYKVVQITKICNPPDILVHIFSLRTNTWREFYDDDDDDDEEEDYDVLNLHVSEHGVLVNETLYWKFTKTGATGGIGGFDLAHEKLAEFDHPYLELSAYNTQSLYVMEGCLANVRHFGNDVCITMLKHPGQEDSIHLSKDLNLGVCKNLVGFTRTGKFFILHKLGELGLVDPRSLPMEYTKLATFESKGKTNIVNHVPSLISPKHCETVEE